MRVIAIDGPAGSGKSTVARAVARRLGAAHLDTGAMYRSVAWAALEQGLDVSAGEAAGAIATLARSLDLDIGERVLVNGIDATEAIRGPEVNRAVSVVAAIPDVRADMVRRQQVWADAHGGGVIEGRDIGSVVFPEAELKVFLTASDDVRALRRRKEFAEGSDAPAVDHIAAELARRDRLDSTRATSPLKVADGAVVIDTSSRSVADVVDEILSRL